MGIAAYQRGNAVISRQCCADAGCSGCVNCREYVPTPRPADWGSKAAAVALDRARRIVAAARRYSLTPPNAEMLALAVRERERVGEATALAAAEKALSETG